MAKRKFSKEFMQDILYGDNDDTEVIIDEISDHSRWSVAHDLVFKYEGKFYSSYYSVGATESQDESPWEYDGDEIECEEVEPVETTVIKYLSVDRESK